MYRTEYPRPDFQRKDWKCLNGTWDILLNDIWKEIEVPFVFQSKLSGIHDNGMYDKVIYRKEIEVPSEWKEKEIILHFGAVDYECVVFVNGKMVGSHIGGNAPFAIDITENLVWDKEIIEVRVFDPCADETIPRGKQFWEEKADFIWYTRTTGIWQSVWLEAVEKQNLKYVRFTPDIDKGNVGIEFEISEFTFGMQAEFSISFKDNEVFSGVFDLKESHNFVDVNLFNLKIFRTMNHNTGWCWSPENPNLFDVTVKLYKDAKVCDVVNTYFGMRKIETKNGMVYLNNRPYYQKLVLDQGYWKETLMTAKEDADFVKDIKMAKEMGFNGCRKHQKAEDPRFLYYADKLGFLVWSEIGACASYSIDATQRTMSEWSELIRRDYNHPCIVTWVVMNESWGVPNIRFDKRQQSHAMALYYNVHSMDDTRLVVSNDGWEQVKTDICAIHNYDHGAKHETDKHESFQESLKTLNGLLNSMPAGREIYAEGYKHEGEPILLTEFGGIAYAKDREIGWGYTTIENETEFLDTYHRLLENIRVSDVLFGYCYTQLADVEQEVNGLLTYEREFKVDPKEIKKINDSVYKLQIKY